MLKLSLQAGKSGGGGESGGLGGGGRAGSGNSSTQYQAIGARPDITGAFIGVQADVQARDRGSPLEGSTPHGCPHRVAHPLMLPGAFTSVSPFSPTNSILRVPRRAARLFGCARCGPHVRHNSGVQRC